MQVRVDWRAALLALVTVVALDGAAGAQTQFLGRIDLTIRDSTGGVLPGVTVDLSGPQTDSTVTDVNGEARFLNLPPGTYEVRASLQGFGVYLNRAVVVAAGNAVPLAVSLSPAGVAEQVDVAAESPQIDVKRTAVGTNVGLEELQSIPNARDPWVVMQTVPTIMVDRVNVGGSESGQQSNYFAKGANTTDNTWNMDGIPVTDMGALGSTPTYYDFDMFQEMNVTTGGADVQATTPGVQLNFVVKQGSNTPHGSARYYYENEDLQSNNLPSELTNLAGSTGKGNRTNEYEDRGFELGGPLIKDRLWAWGSYGRTNVDILTLNGVSDKTELENYAFKAQAALGAGIRPEFLYFRGNKTKEGRGASPTRPAETTWNQDGPTDVYKGQVNFVVGSNLFIAARGAHIESRFTLDPIGGRDVPAYRDTGRVWRGSYLYYSTIRPQDTILADANFFKGRHEVKFGFSWRKARVDSISEWPGDSIYTLQRPTYPENGDAFAQVNRPYAINTDGRYTGLYVGDTMTFDRLTINAALRWDDNRSSALETTQRASAVPSLLPSITAPAVKDAISYSLLSPRIGATYALDESRKTLVRGSYSMFSSQLAAGGVTSGGFASAASYAYAFYTATDVNRDGFIDAAELDTGEIIAASGFDPENPNAVIAYNVVNPDLKSPRTHEFAFGVDRELRPNLALSGTFTYRRLNDVFWQPLNGIRRDDYVLDSVLTGDAPPLGPYSQEVYALPAENAPPGGGREFANREGYHQQYIGFEVQLIKRLSNKWMGRLGFSTNSHNEYFTDPSLSIEDPTPRLDTTSNTYSTLGMNRDGGPVVRLTAGSGKGGVFLIAPSYQWIANGLYQGPWGLNFGANLVARQGYGMPFYAGQTETSDAVVSTKDAGVVENADDFRLPTLVSLDFRVEKVIRIGRADLMLDFDVFNLTNEDTILGREYDVNAVEGDASTFYQVREIMNPRIARLGVRVTF